tara:strand:- start:102 stop:707 length:606 start_codon:yes stop_codon:yes gene_type:complete
MRNVLNYTNHCEFCNKKYLNLRSLKTHISKNHQKELKQIQAQKKHLWYIKRRDNPVLKARDKESNANWRRNNKKKRSEYTKKYYELTAKNKVLQQRLTIIGKLSNELYQCECCNEKIDLTKKKVNLEIHHRYYDESDKTGGILFQIERMEKSGDDITKKFAVLCRECNMLEAYMKPHSEKANQMIKWLKKNKLEKEFSKKS